MTARSEDGRAFVPAAGSDWALPFYDPLVKLMGGDRARRALLDGADLGPGLRVLDVGCGTGTLAVLAKRRHPEIDLVGLDPDLRALERAQQKADRAGAAVRLDQGFADALPYGDGSFDRVLSSFVLHHLEPQQKVDALREVRRVLRPDGRFHLQDFDGHGHAGGPWLHFRGRLRDQGEDQVLALLRDAGFADAGHHSRGRMALGLASYSCYVARG